MLITPQAGYEPEMLRLWSVFCEKQARDFFRFGFTFFSFPTPKAKSSRATLLGVINPKI